MTLHVEQEPLVMVGQSGTIHISSDGGDTWQAHRTREAFDRWLESIDRQLMAGQAVRPTANEYLVRVGIDYCLTHSGTRNEDEAGACDWRWKSDDRDDPCEFVDLVHTVTPDVSVA